MTASLSDCHARVNGALREWVNAAIQYVNKDTHRKCEHGMAPCTCGCRPLGLKEDPIQYLAMGELLCCLVNCIHPRTVAQIRPDPSMFGAMQNLTSFLRACQAKSIPVRINVRETLQGQKLLGFVQSIIEFLRYAVNTCPAVPSTLLKLSELDVFQYFTDGSSEDGCGAISFAGQLHPNAAELLVLTARMASIEDNQQRMMETIASLQQAVLNSTKAIDRLTGSFLDAFHEMQQAAARSRGGSRASPAGTSRNSPVGACLDLFPKCDSPAAMSLHQEDGGPADDESDRRSIHVRRRSMLIAVQDLKNVEDGADNDAHDADHEGSDQDMAEVGRTFLDSATIFNMPLSRKDPQKVQSVTSNDTLVEKCSLDDLGGEDHEAEPEPVDHATTPVSTRERNRLEALKKQLAARLPEAVLDSCRTRTDLLRQSAIYELIQTERDFVRDLSVLVDLIYPKAVETQAINDPEEFFKFLPDLLQDHQKILDLFNSEIDEAPVIESPGKLWKAMIPFLHRHVDHVAQYSSAVANQLLQPAVMEFSGSIATMAEANNQTLDSYMIKPIQRICKYPLLLAEIKKHSFENSEDYPLLETAVTELQCLVEIVDSSIGTLHKDKHEAFCKQIVGFQEVELTPQSQFLREGPVDRWVNGTTVSLHWILFSDFLLLCKPLNASKSLRKKSEIVHVFGTTRIILDSAASISGRPNEFAMDLIPVAKKGESEEMQFLVASKEERDGWVRAVQKAVSIHMQRGVMSLVRRKSQRSLSMSFKKKPWSILRGEPAKRTSVPHTSLPSPPINPRSLPDNVELLAVTLDDHFPSMAQEIGFLRQTYLRIVNCDREDYWKVSMNRVCALVPRGMVEKFESASANQFNRIMRACQSEVALTWLDYNPSCVISMQSTPIAAVIAAAAAAATNATTASARESDDETDPIEEAKSSPSKSGHSNARLIRKARKRRSDFSGLRAESKASLTNSDSATTGGAGNLKEARPITEPVQGMDGWYRVTKPGSDVYFYNRHTNETSWSLPAISPRSRALEPLCPISAT